MPATDATRDLTSIGCLSGQLQTPPRRIEQTAAELQITPALRINAVPHYDGAQVERIASAIREQNRHE